MNMQDLTPTQIAVIIAVVVVAVGAIVAYYLQRRRSEKLRQHFGPEYDRAVAEGGDRHRAEATSGGTHRARKEISPSPAFG